MIFDKLKKFYHSPTFLTWVSNSVILAHGIIVTPLTLKKFNDIEYSYWVMIQTLLAFSLLADSGFGHTLSRSVAFLFGGSKKLPHNLEDYKKVKPENDIPSYGSLWILLKTSTKIYNYLAIAVALIMGGAGVGILWNLLEMSGHQITLWIALILMVLLSLISIQSVKWNAFITGIQLVAIHTRISVASSILQLIAFLIILIFQPNIVYLLIFLMLKAIIEIIIRRKIVLNRFNLHLSEDEKMNIFDIQMFRSLWRSTWRLGISQWGSFFTSSGVSIIISQIKDPALMASFLFTNKIIGFIKTVAEAPFQANLPIVYSLMAKKDYRSIKQRVCSDLFMMIFLFIAGTVSFAILGNLLLGFLGIEKSIIPIPIYIVYTLMLLVSMHSRVHGTIYLTTNEMPFYIPSILTGGIVILFGFLVLPHYGLMGVVVVQLVATCLVNAWLAPYMVLKLLNWKWYNYVRDLLLMGSKHSLQRLAKFI